MDLAAKVELKECKFEYETWELINYLFSAEKLFFEHKPKPYSGCPKSNELQ